MEKELKEGAEKLGIELSDLMVEKFKVYYRELLVWSKKMNLVSRAVVLEVSSHGIMLSKVHGTDEEIVVRRHFLDSLDAAQFIPISARVLDVGSGAGFPGIPIKIVRDDIKLDLLEPKLKRFNFLNHLVNTLSLDIGVYRSRVEDFSGKYKYEIVISRSVGKLKWLTKVAESILADDGIIITYKGSRLKNEFKEVSKWEIEYREPRKFSAGTIVVLKRQ